MAESVETRSEIEGQKDGDAKYWILQLDLSEKDHKDFIENGRDVLKRYKTERKKAGSNQRRINILYSNTETLKSSIYAKQAKPDVRRRFADQDPVGRQVAEVLERSLVYCNDTYDGEDPVEAGIEDYLLPGRGVVRVDYEPTIKGEAVVDQKIDEKYVYWEDFRHEPARKWTKVGWIAYRWLFSRDDLKTNFGADKGERCPLNWTPDPGNSKLPDAFKRAEVWEVWDKTKRKRYWVSKGFPEILRTDDDPYGLSQFFNCAKPLNATTTNETVIPEPEFFSYKDQADGLDEIENRIDRLTRALKRRGVYDATIKELEGLRNAADNQFIPVKSWVEFAQKGGLEGSFQTEDIAPIAKVLEQLHVQREQRVQAIYEITGISDIFRGATDPNETLGAQQMKANFGGGRLKKRQDKIQKWIRDTLRIKAELIAEHFEPAKLQQITGVTLVPEQPQLPPPPQLPQGTPPEAIQQAQQQYQATVQKLQADYQKAVQTGQQIVKILRDDENRSYRVDVETDSTVFEDDTAQKQARTELLTAMTEFIVAWTPVVQAKPELMPMAFEMLAFGARGFKQGRQLEDIIEQTKVKLEQSAQQPPPPDPKMQIEQAKLEAVKQKAQIDGQAQQAKAQADQQKTQMELQAAQAKHAMELEKMRAEMQMQAAELQMMQQKLGLEAEAMQLKAGMEANALERESAHDERAAELAAQSTEHKHTLGLEMMEHKAKQTKRAAMQR